MDIELKKKIGHLFVVGFDGTRVNQEIRTMIEEYYVSNIILFSRNIESPQQVHQLILELQDIAKNAGHDTPLLITVDQENGIVRRLVNGMSHLPGAMALGATGNPQNAYLSYQASATELDFLGINWNLAPDADVNNNPNNPVIGVRSFGEEPAKVADFVEAAHKGMQDMGVATTLKHFPGHGDTAIDSHLDLPTISHDLERLEKVELVPFKRGIEQGADVVMTAHVYFPAIEKGNTPATLSAKIMRELLRHQLNFKGVIVTDCLEMHVISKGVGTSEAAVLSLQSGADMAMISHTFEVQKEAFKKVYTAVEKGKLSLQTVEDSSGRVKMLHEKYAKYPKAFDTSAFTKLVHEHEKLAEKIYQQSVTAVVKDSAVLRKEEPVLVISFDNPIFSNVEDPNHLNIDLESIVQQYAEDISYRQYSHDRTVAEVLEDVGDVSKYQHVILGSLNIRSQEDIQAQIFRALSQQVDISVISLRNPYDYNYLLGVKNFIACYEFTSKAVELAVGSLYGERITGVLPVTLEEII